MRTRCIEQAPGHLGRGVDQERQDIRLGVPEVVPLVARAGQSLGRDSVALAAQRGLQQAEQAEMEGLLGGRFAFPEHVTALPELADLALVVARAAAYPRREPGASVSPARSASSAASSVP